MNHCGSDRGRDMHGPMLLHFPLQLLLFFLGAPAFSQEIPAAPPPPPPAEWKAKLTWSGDLRYRVVQAKEDIDDSRRYQQLRARLGVRADVNETTQAVIRMATATSAISANQTLGDASEPGMVRRPFGIDWAYIDWGFLGDGRVWLGRVANPFFSPAKVQTIWDADLAFEGFAIKWEPKWSRSFAFINLGGFIISENYTAPEDNVDTGLVGGDLGYGWKGESWSWTTHVARYNFLNVKDRAITRFEASAKIDPYSNNPNERFRGNSVVVNDPLLTADQRRYFFLHQFILSVIGTEFKHKIGVVEYTVFGEGVRNDKGGEFRDALEAGASVKWKFVTLSYAEVKKQRDSVIGSFTDSDSNGGGTDNEGNRIGLGFQLGKNASIQVSQFKAKRGIDSVKRKFEMTHVDFAVSF